MKSSHTTTPRTLADCQFDVGHAVTLDEEFNLAAWCVVSVTVGAFIGYLLGVFA